jgi:hypothetical protein
VSIWTVNVPPRPHLLTHSGRHGVLNVLLTVGTPLAVLLALTKFGSGIVTRSAEIIVALLGIWVIARRPGQSVALLVAFVPIQVVGLALLLRFGMPASAVRGMGGLKDALVIGVMLNAVWAMGRRQTRFDTVDKFALCYLGFLVLYLVMPSVLHGLLGQGSFQVRLLAARTNGLFAIAFLAARHAEITKVWRERITNVVLWVAALISVCAIINVVFSSTWNHFLTRTARVPVYQAQVLGVFSPNPFDALNRGFIGGHAIVRAGSLLLDELTLGFYLVIALAICLQRLTAHKHSGRYAVLGGLCMVAIVMTATRSAILSAVIAAIAATRIAARARAPHWLRLAVLLTVGIVAIAPIAGSTTAGQRVLAFTQGTDPSAQAHATSSSSAFKDVLENPLGRGLGTNPRTGARFGVAGHVTSENSYLQVGNELGIPVALVFIGMLLATVRAAWRRARSWHPSSDLALAIAAAGSGLAVGGFFLHVWLDFPTTLTFWSLAGLALARGDSTGADEDNADRAVDPRLEPLATAV